MMRFAPVLLFLFAAPALAGEERISDLFCDDSARLDQAMTVTRLAERVGIGMRGPDAVVEIWIEPSSGDWTLVQRYSNGTSCIVAFGEHWERTAESPA